MTFPTPPARYVDRASLDLSTGSDNGPALAHRLPTGHHGADELDYWGFTWDTYDDQGFAPDHNTTGYHRMNEARWHSPRNFGYRI